MCITPRKKISISKWKIRQGKWYSLNLKKIEDRTNLVKCSNCSGYKLSHRVCPHCGYYNGKQIVTIKSKSRETIIES